MQETTIIGEPAKAVHAFERAGLGKAPFVCVGRSVELFTIPGTGIIKSGTSCDYCGTAIANTFWILSSDGRKFKVGCDCVRKTADQGLIKEVKKLDKKAKKEKRDAVRAEKRENARKERLKAAAAASIAFLAVRPELAQAFKFADKEPILASMRESLAQWGSLTENQVKYAVKLASDLQKPVEVLVEVKEGKREITATVLSVKFTEYMGRSQARMLVKTADGDKIFGSVPRSVEDDAMRMEQVGGLRAALVGKTVKFTATVLRSQDDSFFGFFKRPTKGVVVG